MNDTQNIQPNGGQVEWRGYTIEELRFHRALALVKLEVQKAALAQQYAKVAGAMTDTKNQLMGITASRFTGKLRFLNYVVMGYRGVKTAVNLWNLFKRR